MKMMKAGTCEHVHCKNHDCEHCEHGKCKDVHCKGCEHGKCAECERKKMGK